MGIVWPAGASGTRRWSCKNLLARARNEGKLGARFWLVVYTFVVTEIDLSDVAGDSVAGRRIIRPVKVALEVIVVVAIEDEVTVLAIHNLVIVIAIIALVIVRSLLCVRRKLGIMRFLDVERILEVSAPWYVNEFGWLAARVGLEEHDRG